MFLQAGVSIRLCLFLACLAGAAVGLAAGPHPARKDNPHAAHEHFRHRRAPVGERTLPVERYFTALKRMHSMRQHSLRHRRFLPSRRELRERGISYVTSAEDLGAWSPLGPGNVGGRTRALVIDPRAPETMYAGGVAGGVWKTTDGGGSWEPLDDIMANLAVSTLAIDPMDSNVLYAGTGEGLFNEDALRGAGIFKTTDGGLTWKQLAGTKNPFFDFVNDLVVSPRHPRRLYAATRTGVWRSTNAGLSWRRVLAPKVYGGCLDLALRTDAPGDDLLAACGTRKGTASVWRNAAAERRGGWDQVLSEPGLGRTTLAIAPSDQNVMYALTSTNLPGNLNWGFYALFRSDDGGRTWAARVRNSDPKQLSTWLLSNAYFAVPECYGGLYINQGWYDNTIAVDPVNPDRVWAGGVDLFRSDDGGKTWGLMSYWWGDSQGFVHADQHALVFHPLYDGNAVKTLFVANDGGIYKTDDALAPAVMDTAQVCTPEAARSRWTNINNGYGVTQFYFGLPYPGGETYFGGTQDNGVIRGSQAPGPDAWETLVPGDAGYVAVDPHNPDVLYASLTNLSIYKSTDGWATYDQAISGIDPRDNFLFVTPLVMDPSNPQRLWTAGAHVWRTDDGAASWSRASVQLGGKDSSVSTLAVSPADPDRVLAGTSQGYLHRTAAARTATGETVWPSVRPRKGHVSSVAFDPKEPDVAYATYASFGGTHVWKTTDGGATWKGLDGRGRGVLPDLPVNTIAVDPGDSRRLFLATDLGVFVSTDGGAHWAVENTGFANVITSWLAVLKNPDGTRDLFAFTHGRGAWKVTLD